MLTRTVRRAPRPDTCHGSRRTRRVARAKRVLLALALVASASAVTIARDTPAAGAAVDYTVHNITHPSVWNGRKIFVSPGHTESAPNTFPCGSTATSEYQKAWNIGYALRDQLVLSGYQVMMPKRLPNVSYTTRIDTAYDWWSDKTNNRVLYVPIHSNAHGSTICSQSGGTQLLGQDSYDNQLDYFVGFNGPYETFNQVAARSPGSGSKEKWIHDRCTNTNYPSTVYEICSTKARALRTIYVESDYHDTTAGANWIAGNHGLIAIYIKNGINCYYYPLTHCSFGG